MTDFLCLLLYSIWAVLLFLAQGYLLFFAIPSLIEINTVIKWTLIILVLCAVFITVTISIEIIQVWANR